MNWRHFRAIVRKEFYQIFRDPGTLILLTLGPIFLLLVFVFMLTSDVRDVSTAIIDLSDNEASHNLIAQINDSKEVLVTRYLDDISEADELFDRGEIRVLVVIPERYGDNLALMTGRLPQFQIIVDGTEPTSAEQALERIYTLIDDDLRRIVGESLVGGFIADLMEMPITINTERLYNPELRNLIGFYPGIASMVISLPAIALALAVAREKELGTLEQLVATPISKLSLLLGKITPYLIFGTIDSLVIVGVGVFMFDVPFHGNLLSYTFVAFFFMMSNMGLGLMISVMVKSQQLAMIIAFLVFLIPGFFLSGAFFPIWVMPIELQLDLMALPVTHFVAVSRGMYLQGSTLADLWLNTLSLIVLSFVVLGISLMIFRKKVA